MEGIGMADIINDMEEEFEYEGHEQEDKSKQQYRLSKVINTFGILQINEKWVEDQRRTITNHSR